MRKLSFRRKGVSTMIGGMIVLSIFLTALAAMVYVSQQYDTYQQTVNVMSQNDIDRFSENLQVIYPGLAGPTSVSGCGGACNQYDMTISNLGIGIEIARIYINSTGSGCAPVCILDPSLTAAAYTFKRADRFVNPGETVHSVLLWLPGSVALPNPNPPAPKSTIYIVTTRGRVFSFQWPFPPVGQALQAVNANVASGTMKIAYTGNDKSSKEPGATGGGGSGYCHYETAQLVNAGGTAGNLYFVNPWITNTFYGDAFPTGNGQVVTTVYIYANFTNVKSSPIYVTTGNLLIQVAQSGSSDKAYFVGGTLYSLNYKGTAYLAGTENPPGGVTPNTSILLIYRMNGWHPPSSADSVEGLTFSGLATITNAETGNGYYAASIFLDGLYIRPSC